MNGNPRVTSMKFTIIMLVLVTCMLCLSLACSRTGARDSAQQSTNLIVDVNIHAKRNRNRGSGINMTSSLNAPTEGAKQSRRVSALGKVKRGVNTALAHMENMFGVPLSKSDNEIMNLVESRKSIAEWTSNDWIRVCELLHNAGEREFTLFAINAIDPLFERSDTAKKKAMPRVASNLVIVATTTENRLYGNWLLINAANLYEWAGKYEEGLRVIDEALARMNGGEAFSDDGYISASRRRAIILAMMEKGEEADREMQALFQKYPKISASERQITIYTVTKCQALNSREQTDVERALNTLAALADDERTDNLIRLDARLTMRTINKNLALRHGAAMAHMTTITASEEKK